MTLRPLDLPPSNSTVLNTFLDRFRIGRSGDPRLDVARIACAFASIPYENLTKILRHADAGKPSYRTPDVVIEDHKQFGAGGTCFSLTATLLHLVRSLGLRAEPILADRPYGPNTHSALLVWIDESPHLIDPGYLLTEPIPLGNAVARRIRTSFNEILLTPEDNGRLALATSSQDKVVRRLTFKLDPADPAEFMSAWDASFEWDMMHYPLLTRVVGDEQIYVQGDRVQRRGAGGVRSRRLATGDLAESIAREFGIDESLVRRALAVLRRRGDLPSG